MRARDRNPWRPTLFLAEVAPQLDDDDMSHDHQKGDDQAHKNGVHLLDLQYVVAPEREIEHAECDEER